MGTQSNIVNPFFDISDNDDCLRFHVFSVPHNPTHSDFSCCAFAQKARKLCWMLKSVGHEVYHYGNALSVDKEHPEKGVFCDEHIDVTTEEMLMEAYPNCKRDLGHVDYTDIENAKAVQDLNSLYTLNTFYSVKSRYKEGDYFCSVVPTIQKELYQRLVGLPVFHIETGVGYMGSYLPYRIFESPAIRSWHYGYFASNFERYNKLDEEAKKSYSFDPNTHIAVYDVPKLDAVVPNSFYVSDFDFRLKKKNYFLYLGRVIAQKGLKQAVEICNRLGVKLVVAGPGDFEAATGMKPGKNIEIVGPVGPEKRRDLLSYALAVFCISDYWEPFGGVNIEAMLSATPPIGSDHGGFIHSIRSGYNGYRLSMNVVEEGEWACRNLDKIDPFNLRDYGLRFSNEQIALRYNDYFQNLTRSIRAEGDLLSVTNPCRDNLDWLDYDREIDWPDGWMLPVDVENGERSDFV